MVVGRADHLAETDGGHLQYAAFDRSLKRGVPLDAVDEKNACAFKRGAVHVGGDSFGRFTKAGSFDRTEDGATGDGFGNPQVGKHSPLAFARAAAMAAHCGNNERLQPQRLKVLDRGAHQFRKTRDASAANPDGNARPLRKIGSDLLLTQFF